MFPVYFLHGLMAVLFSILLLSAIAYAKQALLRFSQKLSIQARDDAFRGNA